MRTTAKVAVTVVTVAALGTGGTLVMLRSSDSSNGAAPTPGATSSPSASASPSTAPTATPFPLGSPASGGGTVGAAAVARVLDGALRAPALGARVNAVVVDAVSGAELYSHGAEVSVVPASTTKIATGLAALAALGPQATFRTTVVPRGTVTGGVLTGDLVLVGGGDPTLASPGARVGYPPPARVDSLAAGVRARGITRVTGGIVVDTTLFTGSGLGPGWKPTYVTEGSVAPISALMVDGGRVRPDGDDRVREPDLVAGRLLRDLLRRRGVAIGTAVARGTAPAGSLPLTAVSSPPVGALVERMLLRSDNELAESLGRHIARKAGLPADFAGAAAGIAAALARFGAQDEVRGLRDASGLSRLDRLTVGGLVRLVALAVDERYPGLRRLLSGLPTAAFDGTLGGRFAVPAARAGRGRVRAKTGSLDNVSTLAGTIHTADGRLLVFAFSADRLPTRSTSNAAKALDAAAAALARCGCPA